MVDEFFFQIKNGGFKMADRKLKNYLFVFVQNWITCSFCNR